MKELAKRFAMNASAVLYDRETPIGQFEKELGHGLGYLARQSVDGTMPLWVALEIAQKLNIGIGELIALDRTSLMTKEQHRRKSEIARLKERLAKLESEE